MDQTVERVNIGKGLMCQVMGLEVVRGLRFPGQWDKRRADRSKEHETWVQRERLLLGYLLVPSREPRSTMRPPVAAPGQERCAGCGAQKEHQADTN